MYGVDQCRVCGKPIIVNSPKSLEEQEQALRNPIVPEKVWRERGYLTPPTVRQWRGDPSLGCCLECGRREMRRKWKWSWRIGMMYAMLGALTVTIVVIVTFMRH